MKERAVTTEEIARAIGRSPGTLRNICTPSAPSNTARQLITDYFGCQIWPGLRPGPGVLEIIETRRRRGETKEKI